MGRVRGRFAAFRLREFCLYPSRNAGQPRTTTTINLNHADVEKARSRYNAQCRFAAIVETNPRTQMSDANR
ncbi:hypothetical protein J2X13_005637 [Aminobacter aminovorans]|nr:hypothetical protein [Aminobacter aminovorans]